ncbi:MAG: EAL domain-containing protein [Proteobacteria bacterium]|nr:EAL domain-containing protein [Pseudomonadota bacterium]MBI3496370.1 EAL domain-containing protein [Pseudomonadota bacterium]
MEPTQAASVELRHERDRFVAFAFAAADLLLEVGADGLVIFAAGAARRLTGRAAEALVGTPIEGLLIPPDFRLVAALLLKLEGGQRLAPTRVKMAQATDGAGQALLSVFRLPQNKVCHVALCELPSGSQEEPRDAATGLLTAESFNSRMEAYLAASSDGGMSRKLSLVEIPGLARLSEPGPELDRLLADIGAALRVIASDSGLAGRLNEERFGVVQGKYAEAGELADSLKAIAASVSAAIGPVAIGVSNLDLANPPGSAADRVRAVRYALRQFAASGAAGLSGTSLWQSLEEMTSAAAGRIQSVREAVKDGQIKLIYQPVVRLEDRKLHHYEALARRDDVASIAEFVQFAEQVDLICEIDMAVVQGVLRTLRSSDRSVKIAANLSAKSIENDRFMSDLRRSLKTMGVPAERLLFEVTETTEFADLAKAESVLNSLQAMGHAVCLDDFGAGAASMRYIQALSVDFVKIDGRFIQERAAGPRDRAILEAIVTLCRSVSIKTIVEMVETEEQSARASSLAIDFGQGYLFGRPAPMP